MAKMTLSSMVQSPLTSTSNLNTKKVILKCDYELLGQRLDARRLRVFQAFLEIEHPLLPGECVPVRLGLAWRRPYKDRKSGTLLEKLPVILTICFPDAEKYFGWSEKKISRSFHYGDFFFQFQFFDSQGNSVISGDSVVNADYGTCLRDTESHSRHLNCVNSTYFHADFFNVKTKPKNLHEFKTKCIQLKEFPQFNLKANILGHQIYYVEALVQVTPISRLSTTDTNIEMNIETEIESELDNEQDGNQKHKIEIGCVKDCDSFSNFSPLASDLSTFKIESFISPKKNSSSSSDPVPASSIVENFHRDGGDFTQVTMTAMEMGTAMEIDDDDNDPAEPETELKKDSELKPELTLALSPILEPRLISLMPFLNWAVPQKAKPKPKLKKNPSPDKTKLEVIKEAEEW